MIAHVGESKRIVKRLVSSTLLDQQVSINDFIDHLRKEVSLVRREDPTLSEYHLHDVKLSFQNKEIVLFIDFRR